MNARSQEPWAQSPARPRLARSETHVWLLPLNLPAPEREILAGTLEPGEHRRAERFHFERDRRRFLTARGGLRAILALYLGVAPGEIEFSAGPRGKPRLAGGSDFGDLRFNTSHSGQWAMVAVAFDRELGIDLERMCPARADAGVAARYFAPREVRAMERLSEADRVEGFFNCWTRKEAYVKATGEGLHIPLDAFEVSLDPAEPATLLSVGGSAIEAARWCLAALPAPPGYAAALVSEAPVGTLRRWSWRP